MYVLGSVTGTYPAGPPTAGAGPEPNWCCQCRTGSCPVLAHCVVLSGYTCTKTNPFQSYCISWDQPFTITTHPGLWTMAWCLTGTRPLSISHEWVMMSLYIYTPWNWLYVWYWNDSICDLYECHMQGYITVWFDAGLRFLQGVSNGAAAVLH